MKKHKEFRAYLSGRYHINEEGLCWVEYVNSPARLLYLENGLNSHQEQRFIKNSVYSEENIYGFFFHCLKRFRSLNYQD